MNDKPSIFVVDDMATNRVLLDKILCDDFDLTLVESGEQCMQLLAIKVPSLILLDVQMPGMDGYEVCRRIKGDSDLDQVQIIMVSAFGELEHKMKAYEAGCDDYVTKPFDTEELLAKIDVAIRVRKSDESQILDRLIKVAAALYLESHVISNTAEGVVDFGCALSEEEKEWIMLTNEEMERSNWHRESSSIMRTKHITFFVRGLSCVDSAGRGHSLDQLQMMLRCAEVSIQNRNQDPVTPVTPAIQSTDDFSLSESYNTLNQITQTISDCEFYTRGVMDELKMEIEVMISNLALTEEQEYALLASIDRSASSLDDLEDDFKKNQNLLADGIAGLRDHMGISDVDLF